MEEIVIDDSSDVFTFVVPAKRGYYYLAVDAGSEEEARGIARTLAQTKALRSATGQPRLLTKNIDSIDNLVIPSTTFRDNFKRFGYAHRYVKKRLPASRERFGHKGFLPR